MAASILTDLMLLLNQQISSQEAVNQELSKIEALLEVALTSKIEENQRLVTQHYYLQTLHDLAYTIRQWGEHNLDILLKNRKQHLH